MLRDNLAGLIEPMSDGAGAQALVVVQKAKNGGCYASTELAIVDPRPSWRQVFRCKTGARQKKEKWPFALATEAHDSRAVCTEPQKSHRTIDPRCLENPRPEGAESTLTRERCLSISR